MDGKEKFRFVVRDNTAISVTTSRYFFGGGLPLSIDPPCSFFDLYITACSGRTSATNRHSMSIKSAFLRISNQGSDV